MHFNIFSLFNQKILKHISVEPCYVLFIISAASLEFVNSNLYLQKSCRFNATSEPDLSTSCDDEIRGISFVADVNSIYRTASFVLASAAIMFAAAWSDKAGKKHKQFLVLSITGQLLINITFCLQSYFWYWSPVVGVMCETIINVLFLGYMGVITFSQLYICNITRVEDRTMKTAIIASLEALSLNIGKGVGGFLLHNLGFFRSYLIILAVGVLSWIYSIFFLKSISVNTNEKTRLLDLINLKRITESFQTVLKKRQGNERFIICMLLVLYFFVWFTSSGEESLLYIYLRFRFQWNEQTYAAFILYKLTGLIIGTLICSVILSKILKMHDGLIGVIAGFMDTLAILTYFFATKSWHIYLVPVLDIFHGVALAVCISFLSKFFDSHELGRLFSVINFFCIFTFFSIPVYNEAFIHTMQFFPSAVLLISISMDIVIFLLYGISYFLTKNEQ